MHCPSPFLIGGSFGYQSRGTDLVSLISSTLQKGKAEGDQQLHRSPVWILDVSDESPIKFSFQQFLTSNSINWRLYVSKFPIAYLNKSQKKNRKQSRPVEFSFLIFHGVFGFLLDNNYLFLCSLTFDEFCIKF